MSKEINIDIQGGAPDEKSKNLIDFILVSQRYRNSVKKVKVRHSADRGSNHHLVLARLGIRLKRIRQSKRLPKWNREVHLSPSEKEKFKNSLDNENLSIKGQSSIAIVAE